MWWLQAGNYVDGPPPVEVVTPLHKHFIEQKQLRDLQAQTATMHPRPGAVGLTYNSAVEAVPGVAAASQLDSATVASTGVRHCLSSCTSVVDDRLYRECAQACLADTLL